MGEKMEFTSEEARNLLEKERNNVKDDRWIDHCICVGNSAGKIAKALKMHPFQYLLISGYIEEKDIHPSVLLTGLEKNLMSMEEYFLML